MSRKNDHDSARIPSSFLWKSLYSPECVEDLSLLKKSVRSR